MHTLGNYAGSHKSIDGNLVISFEIDDDMEILQQLEDIKEKELAIDAKPYRKSRSLNANAYFWKLCSEIGKVLGVSKDIVYLMKLRDYGEFNDIEVIRQAVKPFMDIYRYAEEVDSYFVYDPVNLAEKEIVILRCYTGSSEYDSQQMSYLINGTVNDAKDLGIDTWTGDEIAHILSIWRPLHG